MSRHTLTKAIILAGGEGTRLRPMTRVIPKPLARVANKPLLEHIIFGLHQQGIQSVALATGYKAETIEEHFGDGARHGIALKYVIEPYSLGSGGAVRNVYEQCPEYSQGTFTVASADVLHNVDLSAVLKSHRASGAVVTIVCCEVDHPQDVGICEVQDDGRISAFYEKPAPGVTNSHWANIALWIFEPQVVSMIETGKFTRVEDDLFPQLLRDGAPLYAYRHHGYWLDVGTMSRYLQAQHDALAGRFPHEIEGRITGEYSHAEQKSGNLPGDEPSLPQLSLPESSLSELSLVGDGCCIARSATLVRSVLGDAVHVARNAVVENSVLYDGALAGAGAILRRSVIGPNVRVPDGAHLEDQMLF
jgi:mannose-1-phosphate guanylyltransferase/phosphomannomutase